MTAWLLNAAPWIGLALAAAGLTGALWALSPWPRSKRRRCPRCWYDMSGTPDSRRCTECGRTAKSERRLHKRRRRWRMALLGVLVMVLGAAAAATPDVMRGSWRRLVPTTILYATLDWSDKQTVAELRSRLDPDRYAGFIDDRRFWAGWPLRIESVLLRPIARKHILNPMHREGGALAIGCIATIGVREADLPLLATHLNPAADPWLRTLAAHAVAQLGSNAAPILPQLCECIAAGPSYGLPTAELSAIKAMGPAAAPAIEHLRLCLWTPLNLYSRSGDSRRTVIEAAGAIGPPAASLVPDMLALVDGAPHLRVPTTAALIRIQPDDPITFQWAKRVLDDPDVGAHRAIDEALASAPSLRDQLVSALQARAHDQQSCVRLAAVRALISMQVPPRAEHVPLTLDLERPIRLLAERWMRLAADPAAHRSIRENAPSAPNTKAREMP